MKEIIGEILSSKEFIPIGFIKYNVEVALWWNPKECIEIVVSEVRNNFILTGIKRYKLTAITEKGETQIKHLEALDKYWSSHFPVSNLTLLYRQNITDSMALKRIEQKARLHSEKSISFEEQSRRLKLLRNKFISKKAELEEIEQLKHFFSEKNANGISSLLKSTSLNIKKELLNYQSQWKRLETDLTDTQKLIKEQKHKSVASVVLFSYTTPPIICNEEIFLNAINSIIKNIRNTHNFEITQKLCGGQLNVYIEEFVYPLLAYQIELTALLEPNLLERIGCDKLKEEVENCYIVTPTENIVVNGSIKDEKKLIPAKFIQIFLQKLETTPAYHTPQNLPSEGIWIGYIVRGNKVTKEAMFLSLNSHFYISGMTGSGKSVLARVIAEGNIANQVTILILDPRNQAIGLLLPENKNDILKHYKEFGLDKPRSFAIEYYSLNLNKTIPKISQLLQKSSVISFKGLNDKARCEFFTHILEGVFEACTREESEKPKIFIIVEEVQLFLKRQVSPDAEAIAKRAEVIIDKITREGRKFGCFICLVSQTIRDFSSYGASTVRQNMGTKIFLANGDKEVQYASDYLKNGKEIIGLPTGTAIVWNTNFGEVKVKIRPSLSRVCELSEEDTKKLITGKGVEEVILPEEEKKLLRVAEEYHRKYGKYIDLTKVGNELGITSKRKIQALVNHLEQKALIRTEKLKEKGQPRVIIPIAWTKYRTK